MPLSGTIANLAFNAKVQLYTLAEGKKGTHILEKIQKQQQNWVKVGLPSLSLWAGNGKLQEW